MTRRARILVRIMDRYRRVDEFDMRVVDDSASVLVLQAAFSSSTVMEKCGSAPAFSAEAIALTKEMIGESGFSVRTRLLEDGWLLMVRIDKRHETDEVVIPLAA